MGGAGHRPKPYAGGVSGFDDIRRTAITDIETEIRKERERCAQIADAVAAKHNTGSGFDSQPVYSTAYKIAAAIRAQSLEPSKPSEK